MAASNGRLHEQDTVHHITSRIAHRVYFLGEDERNDLIEIARRAAVFCGIRLLAWCVMTNHFHLMVHLPFAIEVSDDEVLRRFEALKGRSAGAHMAAQLAAWRRQGAAGAVLVSMWLDSQRRRMYDVGEYMKIVKQWFSEEYNRRNSHVGTLWESEYHDKPVEMKVGEMARRMGYIHLNPIRAAATATHDGYPWSSFSAFAKGDPVAVAGMRFVYDDSDSPVEALKAQHLLLLDELLEDEKKKRAEEIARRRAAGYEVPLDHLTSEAMVAQAAAQLEKIRRSSEELKFESVELGKSRAERKQKVREAILAYLHLHPDCAVTMLSGAVGCTEATVYWYLRALKREGLIERTGRGTVWRVNAQVIQKQV